MRCSPLWLFGLFAACGSTGPTLSYAERERLPLDARQAIFDAENDLVIARNRVDLAREQLDAVESSLDALDGIEARNQKRLRANPATSGRIALLRQVMRAEREYLDARRDVALAEVDVAIQEIRIAQARLALVKQRQLVRIGKAPSTSLPAMERAIDEQEATGKETRASSLDLRTKAQGLLNVWKSRQADYAAQTGDFDSGIWLQ